MKKKGFIGLLFYDFEDAGEPWGGTKGMYPESNTLEEQHTPSLHAHSQPKKTPTFP
jgi:hypothetical protein